MSIEKRRPRTNADEQRTATEKRDAAFITERKARDAANPEKTLRLKALRLAHEATLPPKPAKPVRKAKKAPL